MPSWMLARLKRETELHHSAADADRSWPLTPALTTPGYRDYLTRVFGFEAPLEAAFATLRGLGGLIDLRSRTSIRALRADLAALGIPDPIAIPLCRSIPAFRIPAEALGWMYVVERNALLHGTIRRHLDRRLPHQLA